jgi:hypothetical protein
VAASQSHPGQVTTMMRRTSPFDRSWSCSHPKTAPHCCSEVYIYIYVYTCVCILRGDCTVGCCNTIDHHGDVCKPRAHYQSFFTPLV